MKVSLVTLLLAISTFAFAEGANTSKSAAPSQPPPSPHEGQPGGLRPPPREALVACDSKKAGDACSFQSPHGALTGTCFTPEASKPLACKPSQAPVR